MQPRHLPVLDGLRAVAILLVLWCHVPVQTPGYPQWLLVAHTLVGPGGLGVDLFFVLSGFLITRILIAEREHGVPVRWFLLRRVLRIFPIYYLLLLVMLFVAPSIELVWCAAYLSNLHSILEPGFPRALGHTWSLCIEEHFYLLWPLVVAFCPRGLPKWLLLCVILPGALSCAYVMDLHYAATRATPETAMQAVQHASPVRFLSLGTGSLIAYLEPRIVARPAHFLGLAFSLLVPAVLGHPVVHYLLLPQWLGSGPLVPWHHAPLVWAVQSCSLSTSLLLLCLTLAQLRWSPVQWLHCAPMRGIGRISYGLYLYHLPIYHAALRPQPSGANVLLAVGASLGVATLSYWAIERPILRFGARFR
jgi:peptidoglycan/LPS O-acetylase OafA/YrhL